MTIARYRLLLLISTLLVVFSSSVMADNAPSFGFMENNFAQAAGGVMWYNLYDDNVNAPNRGYYLLNYTVNTTDMIVNITFQNYGSDTVYFFCCTPAGGTDCDESVRATNGSTSQYQFTFNATARKHNISANMSCNIGDYIGFVSDVPMVKNGSGGQSFCWNSVGAQDCLAATCSCNSVTGLFPLIYWTSPFPPPITPLTVTLNYPTNNGLNNSASQNITYTPVVDAGTLDKCTLYVNGTYNTTNTTAITNNSANDFSNIMFNDGSYNIAVNCNLTNGSNVATVNNTLVIDTAAPTITTDIETYYSNELVFNVTTADLNPLNLTINDYCNLNYTNSSLTSTNFIYAVNVSLLNCSLGEHKVNITSCDNATNCINYIYNYSNMATLNVTATYSITGAAIGNFSVWLNGTALGSTSTYIYTITNLTPGYYNVTIDHPTYALTSAIIFLNATTQTLNFTLFGSNSIQIYILDEITGLPITENISVRFTSNYTTWTNYTSNSTLYVENLTTAEYNILFYTNGSYSTRTYTVTVGNHTTQILTAYMISSEYSTIFTVIDADSSEVVENASISMYKMINSSWVVVESKYSDISGRAQFYYDPVGNYKFYISRYDYIDFVFFLNPILFSTYDIKISKEAVLNYSQDYDGLSIIYSPQYFANNENTTFNFIISSPDGLLIEYGINLTYPNGATVMVSDMDTNAIGGQLSVEVNLSNATVYDTVRLDYYYITTISGRREFTALLPISNVGLNSNMTFINNRDQTHGLGIFERMLIMTISILSVVGIATMVGQPLPGMALGLFMFGYVVYIGFIPIWAILPSMFIGIMFLIWKSGGY